MSSPDPRRVSRSGLAVDERLAAFVEAEALPAAGVAPDTFWSGLALLVSRLAEPNRELLAERERLQTLIDDWHRARGGQPQDVAAYRAFLAEIGYLVQPGPPFAIDTSDVDPEISVTAGPQLVVPASNARYALNAANARWGSLYDALYGTDALGSPPPAGPYDPERGGQVVAWTRDFLDAVVPLRHGTHAAATGYRVRDGRLEVGQRSGGLAELADPAVFTGHLGEAGAPSSVLLTHHGLGIEIVIDPRTDVGAADDAGVSDVVLEAAVTTIVDFEDSVAAVDAADKVDCYRTWLGLLTGELAAPVDKAGRTFTRRLTPPRTVAGPGGTPVALRPHALLLARNVGHLMTTPAVLDADGREIPEGLLDALVTVTCALVDIGPGGSHANSPAGSVYVVKPKMHGPAEVAFADETFTVVEEVLGLARNTVKIGIMDEERRTTVNLAECIRAAAGRVAFINTGFLDRTGDEIHTSMEAGPMVRKAAMRSQPWIGAYEDWNVDVGLACGLRGRAQVGKGMWAAPDAMHDMLAQKGAQPAAGASCAWVPSPTAATLHATHYHRVDVARRQHEIASGGPRADLDTLLTIPVDLDRPWDAGEIDAEVENNAQGILGYVVRWIDQGVGCSKVPDIHGVNLMEDRATCRISSQHIANWLHHGVVDQERVDAILRKAADLVDRQNAGDPAYTPLGPDYDGEAFRAARDLIVHGRAQPSGYTEPLLHAHRARAKQTGADR
ncbi:MAG TPA: malate synthase G [Mycobacteriales bacterium]